MAIELSSVEAASLWLMDVEGRRVRSLSRGKIAPGIHRVTWDGTDASGDAVAPGRYFLIARSAGDQRTVRVPVIR